MDTLTKGSTDMAPKAKRIAEVGELLYKFDVNGKLYEYTVFKAGPKVTRIQIARYELTAHDCYNSSCDFDLETERPSAGFFRAAHLEAARARFIAQRERSRDSWLERQPRGFEQVVANMNAEIETARSYTIENAERAPAGE